MIQGKNNRPIRAHENQAHMDQRAHMQQLTDLRQGLSPIFDTWDIRLAKGEVGWDGPMVGRPWLGATAFPL